MKIINFIKQLFRKKTFPCTGCGCCCKRVDIAVKNMNTHGKYYGLCFPYKYDKTGRCSMLNDDNSCSVYSNRPLVCNVDRLGARLGIDKKEFYRVNIDSCNAMMYEDGVAEEFRIKQLK